MPPALPVSGQKGSWEWLALAAQLPAKPIAPSAGLVSGLVASGRYLFKGITLNNTGGSAGIVTVLDGQDASGVPIFYLAAAATSPASSPFLSDGIMCENGLFIVVATLTGKVTLWAAPLRHYPNWPPGE